MGPTLDRLSASAYVVPTDGPEADGTLSWDSTTLVLVEVEGGGHRGIGFTYADASIVALINQKLAGVVQGGDVFDIPALWSALVGQVRNLGWRGLCANAISAIDCALWDLKARILGQPLARLLGMHRPAVPIYGSGGFTSYDGGRLRDQLAGWVEDDACLWVKMKVGSDPSTDPRRVAEAREAIGEGRGLFVDGNGAYARKQALALAETFRERDVSWFEEPVSSDDLEGLRLLRDRMPAGMEVAAGEYGYEPFYFRRLLQAGAVDVLQADVTRCCGVTGFLKAAVLAEAHSVPLSGHTAPAMHLHAACAAPGLRHLEWFHDHVRIEALLFDGAPVPRQGMIAPDLGRPGHGLTFKAADAARFAV